MPPDESSHEGHARKFEMTRWSIVLKAAQLNSPEGDAALATLCQSYWPPLYAYVRRLGHSPAEAQDLVQEFFARLLAKKYLADVDPARGKFRSFLLLMLKRFMANEWDKANCLKRGRGQFIISIDARDSEDRVLAEPAHEETPEKSL
jgi:DNA-directed RNA polymerase specialized sigma24 family protein